MTTPCVCSHPSFNHFAGEGLCFEFTCGCSEYLADDGARIPESAIQPDARSDVYDGFYRGRKYTLTEEAS